MSEQLSRAHLRARHIFTGTLVLDTALHIGGGRDQPGASDSPVVRDPLGRPFVPGSSFKGAFRAAVERLVPNLAHLGLHTCALQPGYPRCLSTHQAPSELESEDSGPDQAEETPEQRAEKLDLGTAYRTVSGSMSRRLNATKEVTAALIRLERPDLAGQIVTADVLLSLLDQWLCDTCKVFGSAYLAATARFSDLPVQEPWYDLIQVRDGVGIDRDSERARERIKYDYEVIPPGTAFQFHLTVENPGSHDLGLVAIGLQEFISGMVPLGGIRSRGLGRCRLEGLQVQAVNFTDGQALRDYLTGDGPKPRDAKPFLADAIDRLLNPQEV